MLEDLLELLGGDPDAGVLDLDAHRRALFGEAQAHLAAGGGEFERVGDQVLQELLAKDRIHLQGDRLGRGGDRQVDALAPRLFVPGLAQPAGERHQVGVDALELGLAVLHAVELQEVFDDARELLALVDDRAEELLALRGEIASPLRRTISV